MFADCNMNFDKHKEKESKLEQNDSKLFITVEFHLV